MTPAALSYQIRTLEERLGTPLFHRLNRAVRLTEAGAVLAPAVSRGFTAMVEGVRAVHRLSADQALTVTAGPAFTAKWLAPRLFEFTERHPEIELRFHASLRVLDFARDGVDAAIRFGTRDDPEAFTRTLIDEIALPVASPERAARLRTPDDLSDEVLIHDDSLAFLQPRPDWAAWLAAAGVTADAARGPRFSNADHSIDAAMEGGGVALGRGSLVARDLLRGRLVAPFPLAIRTGGQYRFVCPEGREREPKMATFLGWLTAETAAIAPSCGGPRVVDLG